MPANSKTKHAARNMELSSDGKIQIKMIKADAYSQSTLRHHERNLKRRV